MDEQLRVVELVVEENTTRNGWDKGRGGYQSRRIFLLCYVFFLLYGFQNSANELGPGVSTPTVSAV